MLANNLVSLLSSNLVPSAMASGYWQSSINQYDVSSNDEGYVTPNNVAKTTSGSSYRAAWLLTTARLYVHSPPEATKNWGQMHPNHNDYHSDPMEINSTLWIQDITDWWRQEEETHSEYTDHCNGTRDIFCIIPRGVTVEASFCHG
jgi:hypothetical protein